MIKFIGNLKMRSKIFTVFILTGLIPMIILSLITYYQTKNTLLDEKFSKMSLFYELTENRFDEYFNQKMANGEVLGDLDSVINSINILSEHGRNSGQWQNQYAYLDSRMTVYNDKFGFEAIFITDRNGEGIYSTSPHKASLESANFSGREYFQRAMAGKNNFSEFQYSDILNTHFIALGNPIFDRNTNEVIGTINALIPIPIIEEMLHAGIEAIGNSGDIYLINDNGLLHTNTRLGDYSRGAAFNRTITTRAQQDLAGPIRNRNIDFLETGIYKDYLGNSVLGSYGVIRIGDTYLGLVVEVDQDEALADMNRLIISTLIVTLVVLILGILLILFISKLVSKPIINITSAIERIADLDLTYDRNDTIVDYGTRKDEIGTMAKGLIKTLDTLGSMMKNISSEANVLSSSARELEDISNSMAANSEEMSSKTSVVSAAVEEITASIDATASSSAESDSNINNVASAVEEMTASIRNLASAAEETSAEINNVTDLIEGSNEKIKNATDSSIDANQAVNTVATAIKEINLSLNEISSNCERSIAITNDADEKANTTNEMIEKLNNSSKQIGKIVAVINDIADQTNMLALNAAIEAAGAGEAGKGFTVVAHEVKELAKQTAEATEEISQQIDTMQQNMTGAVSSVQKITDVIKEIKDITNAIAAAVTQQSATTGEISNAIIEAAKMVNVISKELEGISTQSLGILRSAEEGSKGVNEIARASTELTEAANEVSKNTALASKGVFEVARSSSEISKGANEITENILEINGAANETAEGAENVSLSAQQLSNISSNLSQLVSKFKV